MEAGCSGNLPHRGVSVCRMCHSNAFFHGGYAYTPGFMSVHDCMRFINTGMFILHTDNYIL